MIEESRIWELVHDVGTAQADDIGVVKENRLSLALSGCPRWVRKIPYLDVGGASAFNVGPL